MGRFPIEDAPAQLFHFQRVVVACGHGFDLGFSVRDHGVAQLAGLVEGHVGEDFAAGAAAQVLEAGDQDLRQVVLVLLDPGYFCVTSLYSLPDDWHYNTIVLWDESGKLVYSGPVNR